MSPPVAIAFSGRTRNFPKKTTEKTKKPKKSSKRNLKMLRKCRHSKSGHLIRPPSTPHVAPSHIDWKSKSDESQSRNRDRSHSRSRADERHGDQIRDLLSPDLTMIAPSHQANFLAPSFALTSFSSVFCFCFCFCLCQCLIWQSIDLNPPDAKRMIHFPFSYQLELDP